MYAGFQGRQRKIHFTDLSRMLSVTRKRKEEREEDRFFCNVLRAVLNCTVFGLKKKYKMFKKFKIGIIS